MDEVRSQCPVCGEVGGFHNRLTHDNTIVPAGAQLPSGWLKAYLEEKKYWEDEQKARLAESVSELSVEVVVVEPEVKTATSVCSAHQETEPGCVTCLSTPAMVLGITESQWRRLIVAAEVSGIASCRYCGFDQYKNHPRCVKCGSGSW